MSAAEAREMIIELIGDRWLAEVRQVDMGRKGIAYIAQLNRSVCLGSPIVIIEKAGKLRYASVSEARAIARDALNRNLLNSNLYC